MSNNRTPIMPMPYLEPRIGSGRVIHLDTIAEILDKLVPAFNTLQREFDEHVALLQPAADTPTHADLLAAIAAYQREIANLRMELDDANAQCGSLAADLAAMTTYRAQADAQRQAATEAAQRADAAEARWAAIPWRSIDIVLGHHVFTSAGAKVAAWYDANRPTAQAQD